MARGKPRAFLLTHPTTYDIIILQRKNQMKRVLFLMTMTFALTCRGAYILWVGVDENAVLKDGYSIPTGFTSWVTRSDITGNAGGRIRIGDTVLLAGWEDPPMSKNVVFDDDITDFCLEMFEDDLATVRPGEYANWQPIRIPDGVNPAEHIEICYDIGYFDVENDWAFVTVATATSCLDLLYNGDITGKHIYETGTLAPPTEVPWRPLEYEYVTDVPEPSTAVLALTGVVLLLGRGNGRRNG